MDLPLKFPFDALMTSNGKEIMPVEESHKEIQRQLDPCFEERGECETLILKTLIYHFSLFLHKYPILKSILQEKSPPENITLLSLLEDALKQNITDLCDMMITFIKFLDKCKGKYQFLFKKKAQQKIIEALIVENTPDNQELLQERNREIDRKRDSLFIKFNPKGIPSDESFDHLKFQVENLCKTIKIYRDKIAAHNDEISYSIPWANLDAIIDQVKILIYDFYTVLSFNKVLGEALGPGLNLQKTKEMLFNEIYS